MLAGEVQVVANAVRRPDVPNPRQILERVEELLRPLFDERVEEPIAFGVRRISFHDDLDRTCRRAARYSEVDCERRESLAGIRGPCRGGDTGHRRDCGDCHGHQSEPKCKH
jgi:hypothetical protein